MAHHPEYGNASANAMNAPAATKGSRINSDVERVLSYVKSVNGARERLLQHTSALGYFSDAPAESGLEKVSPISNNLSNALGELDRAIDRLHGALSLFD